MDFLIELLGIFYAFCFLVSYVPQAIKMYHTKKCDDISISMFLLSVLGYISCFSYVFITKGFLLGIALNCGGGLAMNAVIITLYYKYRSIPK